MYSWIFKTLIQPCAVVFLLGVFSAPALAASSSCNDRMTQRLISGIQGLLGKPHHPKRMDGLRTEVFVPNQPIVDPNSGKTIHVPMNWTAHRFSTTSGMESHHYIDIGIHYFSKRTLSLLSEETTQDLVYSSEIFSMIPDTWRILPVIYKALLKNGYLSIKAPRLDEFADPNNFKALRTDSQSKINTKPTDLLNTHVLQFEGTWFTEDSGSPLAGIPLSMITRVPNIGFGSKTHVSATTKVVMNSRANQITLNGFFLNPANAPQARHWEKHFSRERTSAYLRIDLKNFLKKDVDGFDQAIENVILSLQPKQD